MTAPVFNPESRLNILENHFAEQVAAFRRWLTRFDPEGVLVVLLDIGKNVHWVSATTAAGRQLVLPRRLPADRNGLADFLTMVHALVEYCCPKLVLLGHEPCGVYHEPWARMLLQFIVGYTATENMPEFEYRFFNPYQVKLARRQASMSHRKSDPRDLAAMFDLALRGLGYPAYLPEDASLKIRQAIGFIRLQTRLMNFLEQQIRPRIDQLWPGAVVNLGRFKRAHPDLPPPVPLVQTCPLKRRRLRAILAHCPDPYTLLAMPDEKLLQFFRTHAGRAGPALLNRLRIWAQNAVLPPPPVAAFLAKQLELLFKQYLQAETLAADGQAELAPLLSHTEVRYLPDIPGLGIYDAAGYLTGIGTVQRFQRAAQIWALAGFDPTFDGSGDRPHRVGQISRYGDPQFRNTLYQMGYRVAQNYAPVGLTFLNAIDRGKSTVEATIHAAHRVNRICFGLMRHNRPFDSRATPEMEQEFSTRRQKFRKAGQRSTRRRMIRRRRLRR